MKKILLLLMSIFCAPGSVYAESIHSTPIKSTHELNDMLHKAIINDSAEEVCQAINAGADVNIGRDSKAPVLWAILLKKSKAAEQLLKCGANAKIMYLGHPLTHHADAHIAVLLIRKGASFKGDIGPNFGFDLMRIAIQGKHIELIQTLIDYGWDLHKNTIPNGSIWQIAVNGGSEEIVKLFIKNGANPSQLMYGSCNGQTLTPLHVAICCSHTNIVKLLLETGVDINQKANPDWRGDETPLSAAIRMSSPSIVELLLEHGATL